MSAAAIALAALSALVWGTADYCGGRATRFASALPVTVVSQLCGLPVLAVCLVVFPGTAHVADLAWGAGAGVAGFAGIVLLYRSLAMGAMAVAAPITAVTGAAVPVAVGLALGDAPSVVTLAGVGCAVAAIGLVSMGHGGTGRVTRAVIGSALVAGVLFGLFFVLLAQSHEDTGMWPLAAARAASILLGLGAVAGARAPARLSGGQHSGVRPPGMRLPGVRMRGVRLSGLRVRGAAMGWIVAAGMGDVGANALYLLATRDGLLSVVAPVAALYPVSTVLLALTIDREQVRPVQLVGLGLAATALVLTAV